MQVIVQISDLKKALTLVGPAVPTRAIALPVLHGARVDATAGKLTVTGTDLDLTITASVPARCDRPGSAVVPHRLLKELLHGVDEVTLELDGAGDLVATNGSVSRLRPLPLDEWPRTIDAGFFSKSYRVDVDAVRRVLPAASSEDSRPILTGVYFDGEGSVAATDSYRLHMNTLQWPMPKMLIPSRTLAAVVAAATARSRKGRKAPAAPVVTMLVPKPTEKHLGVQFRIEGADLAYTSRVVEGAYPRTATILDGALTNPNRSLFDRDLLLSAVKQVATFVRDSTTPVRIALEPGASTATLTVYGFDIETATATVPVTHEGAAVTIAFNPTYLQNVLAFAGPAVSLTTIDGLKPAVVRTVDADDGYTGLLMPVRIVAKRTP